MLETLSMASTENINVRFLKEKGRISESLYEELNKFREDTSFLKKLNQLLSDFTKLTYPLRISSIDRINHENFEDMKEYFERIRIALFENITHESPKEFIESIMSLDINQIVLGSDLLSNYDLEDPILYANPEVFYFKNKKKLTQNEKLRVGTLLNQIKKNPILSEIIEEKLSPEIKLNLDFLQNLSEDKQYILINSTENQGLYEIEVRGFYPDIHGYTYVHFEDTPSINNLIQLSFENKLIHSIEFIASRYIEIVEQVEAQRQEELRAQSEIVGKGLASFDRWISGKFVKDTDNIPSRMKGFMQFINVSEILMYSKEAEDELYLNAYSKEDSVDSLGFAWTALPVIDPEIKLPGLNYVGTLKVSEFKLEVFESGELQTVIFENNSYATIEDDLFNQVLSDHYGKQLQNFSKWIYMKAYRSLFNIDELPDMETTTHLYENVEFSEEEDGQISFTFKEVEEVEQVEESESESISLEELLSNSTLLKEILIDGNELELRKENGEIFKYVHEEIGLFSVQQYSDFAYSKFLEEGNLPLPKNTFVPIKSTTGTVIGGYRTN